MSSATPLYRIGIDMGGTKIEGICLSASGETLAQRRVPTPRENYHGTIETIAGLIKTLEKGLKIPASIGVGMPGGISPTTGLVQNANSTWLNGRRFDRDLSVRLGRKIRTANDANCFALSERVAGNAPNMRSLFGVIIGTGCGGGLIRDGKIINGPRGIGGEWGHNPLPWMTEVEFPGPECWCGRRGCMETWVSGPGLSADHQRRTGEVLAAHDIARHAETGDTGAKGSLELYADRLARGLAGVVNMFDPDVIVLGGGLSNLDMLYHKVPQLMAPHIFADNQEVIIRPPIHGDSSGVRGAAWLWDTAQ